MVCLIACGMKRMGQGEGVGLFQIFECFFDEVNRMLVGNLRCIASLDRVDCASL